MVVESEKRIMEVIKDISNLCPIKISFNGVLLYDDYTFQYEIEDGVYGERLPPEVVLPERLWHIEDYLVTSMKIEIVDYHHSIIEMFGEYSFKGKDNNNE